jgi:predicted ATPase
MESAVWAGERPPGRKPVRMVLGVGLGASAAAGRDYAYEVAAGLAHSYQQHSYEVELGFRVPTAAAFELEPQVKEETLTFHHRGRAQKLLERRGPAVFARDADGRRNELGTEVMASETALGALEDPARFPDIHVIRRTMLDWRFYHDVRTDAAAPIRQPCLAVTSPTLASDASNLAAVLATLVHIREDTVEVDRAIDDAFPGARLVVPPPGRTAQFGMVFPDHPKRVFEAGELSDGTLRYLALVGALLAYRLPTFVALNEPETSLHAALLEPLARMIVAASQRTQVWLVTHSPALAASLAAHGGVTPRAVIKRGGATWLEGLGLGGEFLDREQ